MMTDRRIDPSRLSVAEAVATRRSIRAFTDEPVSVETLRRVLDRARWSPSGSNFQPWEATVLTGEPLRRLQARIQASDPQDPIEYTFSAPEQSPRHLARRQAEGSAWYGALGIARDDRAGRDGIARENMISYGAPVLLVCYLERFNTAPQWSDLGMWLQTVMLLLREEGLDSCAQQFLTLYARVIKEEIGVSDDDFILFGGLAIGHRAPDMPVNGFERRRVPLDEQVRFLGFE